MPKRREWSQRQKRAYHRVLSGLRRQRALRRQVRFLTLTSAPNSDFSELLPNYQVLRKRVLRQFGFRMEYIEVKTTEGLGVLHILFVGGYIPQGWLSTNWQAIHGACMVDIRKVRSDKRIAGYLVSQYLAGQTRFSRYSWSWGWVARGFASTWRKFLKLFGYPGALGPWHEFLAEGGVNVYVGWDPPPHHCDRFEIVGRVVVERTIEGVAF